MCRGLVTGSVDVRYGRKGRRLGSAADKALGMSGVGNVEGSLARDRAFLDAPEVNVRGREECDAAVAMLVGRRQLPWPGPDNYLGQLTGRRRKRNPDRRPRPKFWAMPGKRITDFQVLEYKDIRRSMPRSAAAAKVAISERSARRIEKSSRLPSQSPPRHWRTRVDPLGEVWTADLVPLLVAAPHLNAATLLEELQRRHPADYGPGILRTLQRRLRQWRVQNGGEREIFFAQEHPPGRQGLSDFTVADDLGTRAAASPFRTGSISLPWHILAGGTFRSSRAARASSLLPPGCKMRCGAPAALPKSTEPTACPLRFEIFRRARYSNEPSVTNRSARITACARLAAIPGNRRETGSIEARNRSLKVALRQGLMLRGSSAFEDRAAYVRFVESIVARMNGRVAARFAAERNVLRPLPARRTAFRLTAAWRLATR